MLILDEPTNDLDTDMLAAIEDLLDSFPGTLLVVSHDRYLLERVTDQQYAVLDGALPAPARAASTSTSSCARCSSARHARVDVEPAGVRRPGGVRRAHAEARVGGAELRNAQKEFAAAGRTIEKLTGTQIADAPREDGRARPDRLRRPRRALGRAATPCRTQLDDARDPLARAQRAARRERRSPVREALQRLSRSRARACAAAPPSRSWSACESADEQLRARRSTSSRDGARRPGASPSASS